MNNKTAHLKIPTAGIWLGDKNKIPKGWQITEVKSKLLPCRRLIEPSTEKLLNKLAYLSETERERIDRQVMERAMSGLRGNRFISKYQRVTLAQQFVCFLLVMLSAFIMAITIGSIVRKNRQYKAPSTQLHYKLINQK